MMIKEIDIKNLIKKTVLMLQEYPLSISLSPRNESSLWSRLCVELIGIYSFTDSLLIQTWWKRDKDTYRSRVTAIMYGEKATPILPVFKSSDNCTEKFDSNVKIIFNKVETQLIKKFVSNGGSKGRRYFLKGFEDILNSKIKKFVPCFMKSMSNWFKDPNSRKSKLPFWKGKYKCCIEDCDVIFHVFSFSHLQICQDFELEISWNGEPKHKIKFEKLRCAGEQRKTLGVELTANGIENTRNEIILNKGKE